MASQDRGLQEELGGIQLTFTHGRTGGAPLGPGSNNCHLNLCEQGTVAREGEEDEEGERGREEERKEGGSDSVEIRGDFGSQPKRDSNIQIAQSPGRVSWDHILLLHKEIKCQ